MVDLELKRCSSICLFWSKGSIFSAVEPKLSKSTWGWRFLCLSFGVLIKAIFKHLSKPRKSSAKLKSSVHHQLRKKANCGIQECLVNCVKTTLNKIILELIDKISHNTQFVGSLKTGIRWLNQDFYKRLSSSSHRIEFKMLNNLFKGYF